MRAAWGGPRHTGTRLSAHPHRQSPTAQNDSRHVNRAWPFSELATSFAVVLHYKGIGTTLRGKIVQSYKDDPSFSLIIEQLKN